MYKRDTVEADPEENPMARQESQTGTRSPRSEQTQSGDEAEYLTLRELRDNPGPVGCWHMQSALSAAGVEMSEATVGRLLKELDSRGLTQPIGSKGRILTADGRQRVQVLEEMRRRWASQDDLLQSVQADKIEDIVCLIVARRAVEVETARLAASNASEADIHDLQAAVESHRNHRLGLGGQPGQNPIVHQIIARASGNRVLQALVNLLYENQELIDSLFVMQRATRSLDADEHLAILNAIVTHDPDRAAMAMRIHFDRLIAVVERYGKTHTEAPPTTQR